MVKITLWRVRTTLWSFRITLPMLFFTFLPATEIARPLQNPQETTGRPENKASPASPEPPRSQTSPSPTGALAAPGGTELKT